jgi:hypothetical protein
VEQAMARVGEFLKAREALVGARPETVRV